MNLRSYLKPYIKINSKWKINIRHKTTELTEENKEKAWFGQRFRRAQKVRTEKHIDQLHFIKIQNFCVLELLRNWRQTFLLKLIFDKWIESTLRKNSYDSVRRQKYNKESERSELSRHQKIYLPVANAHMKSGQHLLLLGKCQIKPQESLSQEDDRNEDDWWH